MAENQEAAEPPVKGESDCLSVADAVDVETAAASLGIELRGEDGQPFCCGARMDVKGGIVGVDYAKCETCGNFLWRIDSPHMNGGYVFSGKTYDEMGENLWIAEPSRRSLSAHTAGGSPLSKDSDSANATAEVANDEAQPPAARGGT